MSIFLNDLKKTTVACHRKKHGKCKNQKETCECDCHMIEKKNRILELEEKLKKAYLNDKSHMEVLSN